MRDLLTNIKKAIEVLNKNKGLTIQFSDPNIKLTDVPPIGISKHDWEKSLKVAVRDICFTADDLYINFDCSFIYTDLLILENDTSAYTEAMKRIIKAIYEQYKWAKSVTTANIGSGTQTITGTVPAYPVWGTCLPNSINGAFSRMNIGSDMEVHGVIDADDIKVNGGRLSVSAELDAMEKRNQALKAEIDTLKAILATKGVI